MSAAADLPTVAFMPARWLRAGDLILVGTVTWRVLRVSVTPHEPTVAVVQRASGDLAGRQHETMPFGPEAAVARVTAMPRADASQQALV